MVDKVEIAADHFKYQKCFRRGLCIYLIILVICTLGCIVGHQIRNGRHHHGVGGHHSGQQGHLGMKHVPVEPKPMPMPTGRPQGPRPEERGCWKPRQPVNPQEAPVDPKVPESPVTPEEPAKPEDAPVEESKTRSLQSVDTSSATSQASSGAASQVNPTTGAASASGSPGQTEPAGPAPWWRRHGQRPWRRSGGHWGWRRHGGMMRGPYGRRGGFRRGRRCFIFKIIFFWVIVPLLMFLGKRCARKRVARRVRQLLEVENRILRAKYGFEWSTNWKVSKLTLRRVGVTQNLGYPAQPAYAMHPERTPFCDAHQSAPLFTEAAPAHHHHPHTRRGYERVSLDDSSIGYNYQ